MRLCKRHPLRGLLPYHRPLNWSTLKNTSSEEQEICVFDMVEGGFVLFGYMFWCCLLILESLIFITFQNCQFGKYVLMIRKFVCGFVWSYANYPWKGYILLTPFMTSQRDDKVNLAYSCIKEISAVFTIILKRFKLWSLNFMCMCTMGMWPCL